MSELSDRTNMRSAWETVRLAETISHAFEHTSFYQGMWREHDVAPAAFVDRLSLSRFPTFAKADIARDPTALVSQADPPDNIRDTSGTTGVRLPVYMNLAEDQAMATLKAARSRGHPSPRLTLRLLPPPRRLNPLTERAAQGIGSLLLNVLPGYDPGIWYDSIDLVLGVLLENYYVGSTRSRVDVIHTTPPPLFGYITQEFVNRGIDPARFDIPEVLLTGGPLAQHTRRSLSEIWKAKIHSTYSCTEVRGAAMECPLDPTVFHPDPCMIAEVLDCRTHEHVNDGEAGEVVLTGLYPFQRVMPMIRYRIGDLARFSRAPCACGSATIGLRILGRVGDGLDLSDLSGGNCILGTSGFLEAIGEVKEVPRFPYPRVEVCRTSQPQMPDLLEIKIEATNPKAYDARTIEQGILQRLRTTEPQLANLERQGRLNVKISLVDKNSLGNFFKLYPGR
jgi:phenylacetate-coenzyme A ligase PaaK-like adenylate-forming protein